MNSKKQGYAIQYKYTNIFDKWILSIIEKTKININKYIKKYKFNILATELYNFVWNEFCDWYIEILKVILKENIYKNSTQYIMKLSFLKIIKILHPIIPYITEEIWENLNINKKILLEEKYPNIEKKIISKKTENEILWIKKIVYCIRDLISETIKKKNNIISIKKYTKKNKLKIEKYKNIITKISFIENIMFISKYHENKEKYIESQTCNMTLLLTINETLNKKNIIEKFKKKIKEKQNQLNCLETNLKNKNFEKSENKKILNKEKNKIKENIKQIQTLNKNLNNILL